VWRERLGERLADRSRWVERAVGVLEHDLQVGAEPASAGAGSGEDVLAVERDRPCRGRHESQHRARDRRLARSRLADQTHRLARPDRERDVVDGSQRRPAADQVFDPEVLDAQQRVPAHDLTSWS
jgi:hypothetical protein